LRRQRVKDRHLDDKHPYGGESNLYFITKGTNRTMTDKINKTDEEWREELTLEQYHVMREKGTERPFTGVYHNTHDEGTYLCAACGNELFDRNKIRFRLRLAELYAPIAEGNVKEETDTSHGMKRTEITCAKCGSHLGHVFDDGPQPTGQRYCMNSVSLKLDKEP
jgi:peptide-methionine (R)-S-oxide reductase